MALKPVCFRAPGLRQYIFSRRKRVVYMAHKFSKNYSTSASSSQIHAGTQNSCAIIRNFLILIIPSRFGGSDFFLKKKNLRKKSDCFGFTAREFLRISPQKHLRLRRGNRTLQPVPLKKFLYMAQKFFLGLRRENICVYGAQKF